MRSDQDFSNEIDSHVALETDRLVAEGMSPVEARAAALKKFGNVTASRERFYESRRTVWLDDLRRDVGYALRALARAPAFSAMALVTLALGIGATTAIFSVVDHVLFRPLPYPHADRLVRLFESNPGEARPQADPSVANAADWRTSSRTIEALTMTGGTTVTLTGGSEPEEINAMLVGRSFFDVFGESLALGHAFLPADYDVSANAAFGPIALREVPAGNATVIISEQLWRRRFNADAQITGRQVKLNGRPATVAGVMRADFRFDETLVGAADCWIPLVEQRLVSFRRFRQFTVVGRLAPGVQIDAARAEMDVVAETLRSKFPVDNSGWSIRVAPLHETIVGTASRVLWVMLVGIAGVLLIACVSIAGLLLMRASRRAREFAVRAALGAGRSRLARQWLTESIVLSLLGGAAALLVAHALVPMLVAFAPPALPRLDEVVLDARMLAFGFLLSLVTGAACGLGSAAFQRHAGPAGASLTGAAVGTPSRRVHWLRQSLVVCEIVLAVVLLVAAGLMLRTVIRVQAIDLGFSPRHVLTFTVAVRGEQYRSLTAMQTFSRALIDRLSAVGGVEAVGVGAMPLSNAVSNRFIVEEGYDLNEVIMNVPSPGYFKALGMRRLYGRLFLDDDHQGSAPVAIVSRQFAVRAWGHEDATGRRLRPGQANAAWITVVGVVGDVRMTSLEAEPPAVVYLPAAQTAIAFYNSYVVRTAGAPEPLEPFVRQAVAELDPSLALRFSTAPERVADAIAPRAFNMWLIGLYALVALTLALVGLYGLLSEAVASRTAEIGVRMALGAARGSVLSLVLARGMIVAAVGTAIGLSAASTLTRFLSGMLFGITPLDGPTFLGIAALFTAVAALACYVPARRASKVDPVVALRVE